MNTKNSSCKYDKLILFTDGYPYGDSEVTFLHEEVKVLKDYFDKIVIVPLKPDFSKKINELPGNAEIFLLSKNLKYSKRNLSDFISVGRLIAKEMYFSKNLSIIKHLFYHVSELFVFLSLAKEINDLIKSGKINASSDLFYTYWFDEWSSALMIVKEKYSSKIKFISRAHGFDIYEERNEKGYIFPRHLQMKFIDKVYSISENGKNYLAKRFSKESDKISCSHLGTKMGKDPHQAFVKEKLNSEAITLVSCSSIVPVKRVSKIVDILSYCKRPVNWIHFGDGNLKDQLVNIARILPLHTTMQLMGNVKNEKIKEFYAKNHIDWFINVSESEGIPVSIMEAISYGIPVIATNVGGTKEIVNSITGILIEKNFDPIMVTQLIENTQYTSEQRKSIHDFWKKNFNAESNFEQFADSLQGLTL